MAVLPAFSNVRHMETVFPDPRCQVLILFIHDLAKPPVFEICMKHDTRILLNKFVRGQRIHSPESIDRKIAIEHISADALQGKALGVVGKAQFNPAQMLTGDFFQYCMAEELPL